MTGGKMADQPVTREEYGAVMHDVIRLSAGVVKGEIPDRKWIEGMDLSLLYKASKQHLLTAIVAYALESAGVYNHAFMQAKAKAIRKLGLMDAEMSVLFEHLEQAGIWYVPLKGTLLKDYYPAYGLRQMADHDILIDAERAEDVKDIMEVMGFTSKHFGAGVHDCYYKEPVCNFEMHRALFGKGNEDSFLAYYSDVKSRLVKKEGRSFEYHFTPEDFYIYMIAHEYKHYSAGGTGLRSLLDTYVYLQKVQLDMDYVAAETDKLGIREFEERNRSLSRHLFTGQTLSEEESGMLEYILFSGIYGSTENSIRNRMKKITGQQGRVTGGMKFKYYINRLFPRQDLLYPWYPLAKYKVLIPFVWVYRIVKAVLVRGRKVVSEIQIVEKQDKI